MSLSSLITILDFFSMLHMMAERAALKPAVNNIELYLIICAVSLCVNSSSSPSLYQILYQLPLFDASSTV